MSARYRGLPIADRVVDHYDNGPDWRLVMAIGCLFAFVLVLFSMVLL